MLPSLAIPLALACTGFVVAQILGRTSLVSGVVGGVVAVYAEMIVLAAALSIGGNLNPGAAASASAIVAVGAITGWVSIGRPRAEWGAGARRLARIVADDKLLLALAAIVLCSLGYLLALSLATPHAEGDSLAYHIARAGYWLQQGGLGAVPGNVDPRIDGSPPAAEIAVAFTMLASGGIQLAGLIQFVFLLAALAAIFGLARRLGYDERGALSGALVFPLASVVMMQAPTALNDLVVAALACSAAYLLLVTPSGRLNRRTHHLEVAVGAVCLGCLALTKVTAAITVPGVLLVVLVAAGWRRAALGTAATAVAMLPALAWLKVGPQTPSIDSLGGVHSTYVGLSGDAAATTLARVMRLGIETLELPGAGGADALVYIVAGFVTLAIICLARRDRWYVAAALGVALTAALTPAASLAARAYRRLWYGLGRDDLATLDVGRRLGIAESTFSWYGPVVVTLIVLTTVVLVARRHFRLAAVAATPILWLVAYGSIDRLGTTTGRFLMGSVAIAAATWGTVLTRRPVLVWVVPTALAGALLTIVHFGERPLGVRLFAVPAPQSAWRQPFVEGVGVPVGLPSAARYVDVHVPEHGELAIGPDIMPTQFFGPRLTRTLFPVRELDDARPTTQWALLRPVNAPSCASGWRRIDGFSPYVVAFRRSVGNDCLAK